MPRGISDGSIAIASSPFSYTGKTDVSSLDQLKSRRPAERTLCDHLSGRVLETMVTGHRDFNGGLNRISTASMVERVAHEHRFGFVLNPPCARFWRSSGLC